MGKNSSGSLYCRTSLNFDPFVVTIAPVLSLYQETKEKGSEARERLSQATALHCRAKNARSFMERALINSLLRCVGCSLWLGRETSAKAHFVYFFKGVTVSILCTVIVLFYSSNFNYV